tara:strand:- start:75 stop:290 length:216 start_codon:yes stop_codon:yes gene_type:complete
MIALLKDILSPVVSVHPVQVQSKGKVNIVMTVHVVNNYFYFVSLILIFIGDVKSCMRRNSPILLLSDIILK